MTPALTLKDRKITVREAAHILGVSKWTIQELINDGTFVCWKPNPSGKKQLLLYDQVKKHEEEQVLKAARRAKALRQMEFDF